jgi:hypothetical protein
MLHWLVSVLVGRFCIDIYPFREQSVTPLTKRLRMRSETGAPFSFFDHTA